MQSHHIRDFQILKTIGTGTFARVVIARLKNQKQGTYYAIKMINKEVLAKLKQVEHAKCEKRVLMSLDNPFILKVFSSFQDNACLYLVMEYIAGGELFTRLRLWHHFPNDVALFYATEILLAIEYIHSNNIIYRDLKPENLLIDHTGHIKIADFGFCKHISQGERTFTLCGTPEYLAPEIIKSIGHSKPVDWWAFGILVYEMLVGHPPFFDNNPYKIYKKIVKGEFEMPEEVPHAAAKLISRLLVIEQENRLGSVRGSIDIKAAKWFRGVDWGMVCQREIRAPWIPNLSGPGDTSSFANYPDDDTFFQPASASVNELFRDF
ncbi:PRKACB_1 [Blepharisma stoltei]|uniref:cAMP-dependent protein kinase catalytic subunit n=1 Tax=Blepharisma stoltei TaxID=1481888 RepID=A0AAU9JT51_9CILI|nr:unnamed protein product [Blepharisma stoltei]